VVQLACLQIRLVIPADGQISSYLWNFSQYIQSLSFAEYYFVTVSILDLNGLISCSEQSSSRAAEFGHLVKKFFVLYGT